MRNALFVLMFLFGVFLAIGCVAEENEAPAEAVTPAEAETPIDGKATETQNVTEKAEMKEYTLEELAQYNGKNGKTYVAYQGQVYDVSGSDLWNTGTHQGLHNAGQNLTEEITRAPHSPEKLKDFPVVGTLKN